MWKIGNISKGLNDLDKKKYLHRENEKDWPLLNEKNLRIDKI